MCAFRLTWHIAGVFPTGGKTKQKLLRRERNVIAVKVCYVHIHVVAKHDIQRCKRLQGRQKGGEVEGNAPFALSLVESC